MGRDNWVCVACKAVVDSEHFVRCASCDERDACKWCAKDGKSGEHMTPFEFEKSEAHEKVRKARAKAQYAYEKACIAAEMHGKPRPAQPEQAESGSDEEEEEEEDTDDPEWYCDNCTGGGPEERIGPTVEKNDIITYLLAQQGITLETAKAKARRAKIVEEIKKEDHHAAVKALQKTADREAAKARVAVKQADVVGVRAVAGDAKAGQKRKALPST